MTPILRAMIEALWMERHSSEEVRRHLRRCLRIAKGRDEHSRFNEIPAGRDHSQDLRFIEP